MPSGIIVSSGSIGTKQEDVDAVLKKHFGEDAIERPDPKAEPERDAFGSDEEFSAAHEQWKAQSAEPEVKETDEEKELKEFEDAAEPRKKSKFQKRIEKLLAPYERKIAELSKQLETKGGTKEPEPQVEDNPRPKRADFANDEEGQQKYEDSLILWGHKKAAAEEGARSAAEEETERVKGLLEHYEEDKERAYEVHEDFADVVGASKVMISKNVHLALLECDEPCEIVYYLAKHPEYAAKLYEMHSQLSAVMEVRSLEAALKGKEYIGRLEFKSGKAGSTAGSEVKPKPKPQLPAPIRPLNTAATNSTVTSRDAAQKGDFASFKAARRSGR